MDTAPAIGPVAARYCQSCGGAMADHPTGIACRRRSPRPADNSGARPTPPPRTARAPTTPPPADNSGARPEAAAIRRALALYFSLLAAICLANVVEQVLGPMGPASAIRFEAVACALISCLVIGFA